MIVKFVVFCCIYMLRIYFYISSGYKYNVYFCLFDSDDYGSLILNCKQGL